MVKRRTVFQIANSHVSQKEVRTWMISRQIGQMRSSMVEKGSSERRGRRLSHLPGLHFAWQAQTTLRADLKGSSSALSSSISMSRMKTL